MGEAPLPAVTIVIEWENAIDVEDRWTDRAMRALRDELARCSNRFAEPPVIMYLYDDAAVSESTIGDVIEAMAPDLRRLAHVELVPAPGLTYYQLKNRGVARARTGIAIILDSDAGPQPGWLDGLLAPFADPAVQAVGGFTVLGWEDWLSKTMALTWIFDLPSERERTVRRRKIHPNNAAFRTEFFRKHPFPVVPGSFKKSCGFWLRRIEAEGARWVRTADAMTVHAPHPGMGFILWRAWATGRDRDVQLWHMGARSRPSRAGRALWYWARKVGRGWWRIWTKGAEVALPVWQRPAAMLVPLAFYTTALVGALSSAATRSFESLPERQEAARAG